MSMILDLLWQSKIDDQTKMYIIVFGMMILCCLFSIMSKNSQKKENSSKNKQTKDQNLSAVLCGTLIILLFLYFQYK